MLVNHLHSCRLDYKSHSRNLAESIDVVEYAYTLAMNMVVSEDQLTRTLVEFLTQSCKKSCECKALVSSIWAQYQKTCRHKLIIFQIVDIMFFLGVVKMSTC